MPLESLDRLTVKQLKNLTEKSTNSMQPYCNICNKYRATDNLSIYQVDCHLHVPELPTNLLTVSL